MLLTSSTVAVHCSGSRPIISVATRPSMLLLFLLHDFYCNSRTTTQRPLHSWSAQELCGQWRHHGISTRDCVKKSAASSTDKTTQNRADCKNVFRSPADGSGSFLMVVVCPPPSIWFSGPLNLSAYCRVSLPPSRSLSLPLNSLSSSRSPLSLTLSLSLFFFTGH